MFWAQQVYNVKFRTQGLGMSPAAVGRSSGIIYLNKPIWDTLSKDEKRFVLLHEYGHIVGRTTNEFKADDIAHQHYIRKKKASLKATVFLLIKILGPDHPRVLAQLARCQQYDLNLKRKK